MPSSPSQKSANLAAQQEFNQASGVQIQNWPDPQYNKQAGFVDLEKRDAMYHQVQLPQGSQAAQSIPHTAPQLLPVGTQGFQQNAAPFQQQAASSFIAPAATTFVAPATTTIVEQPLATATTTTVVENVQTVQMQQAATAVTEQCGTIALKPICIEQEAVSFRPGPITIEQPPLMVQPEAITIPQPPIVIHPEPIVIPQAPLMFQPPAVALARQAVTYQPDAITLARPSYTVQPIIQYDTHACANFGQADFKQHVHIRLSNEQLMRQSGVMPAGGQWVQANNLGSPSLRTQPLNTNFNNNLNNDGVAPGSPVGEKANFFSRDRDYNYGNYPSTTDKLKDKLGVSNTGPQKQIAPAANLA